MPRLYRNHWGQMEDPHDSARLSRHLLEQSIRGQTGSCLCCIEDYVTDMGRTGLWSFRCLLKFLRSALRSSSRSGGFSRVFLVQRQPAMVSITQPPDDCDPQFVVANGERAGPTPTLCY